MAGTAHAICDCLFLLLSLDFCDCWAVCIHGCRGQEIWTSFLKKIWRISIGKKIMRQLRDWESEKVKTNLQYSGQPRNNTLRSRLLEGRENKNEERRNGKPKLRKNSCWDWTALLYLTLLLIHTVSSLIFSNPEILVTTENAYVLQVNNRVHTEVQNTAKPALFQFT